MYLFCHFYVDRTLVMIFPWNRQGIIICSSWEELSDYRPFVSVDAMCCDDSLILYLCINIKNK